MLEMLGIDSAGSYGRERVAFLVGPNGAGKSNFLRELATSLRQSRNIAIISNTPYDRFSGMRGIKRLSSSRGNRSPKLITKIAVIETLNDGDGRRFYQVEKILEYCGYIGKIGFLVRHNRMEKFGDLRVLLSKGGGQEDINLASSFFERANSDEMVWVGDRSRIVSFSQGLEFVSVLRLESELRNAGIVVDIDVYLQRQDGSIIELSSASSGELTLISTLLFLIANDDMDPLVLIDEPENSLHPNWQREYVDRLLNALEYRSATIVIATHAPLVVTGALASARDIVSVHRVEHGEPRTLDMSAADRTTESIEAVLWEAFDVITPASHFVSKEMVDVVGGVESGEIAADVAIAQVNAMDRRSFDATQQAFFGAVRELIVKVEAERTRQISDE